MNESCLMPSCIILSKNIKSKKICAIIIFKIKNLRHLRNLRTKNQRNMKWRKQHKMLGIGISVFMLMFCLSGIVLNHRKTFADCEVSRRWLPSRYEYRQWNGGLMRGTVEYKDGVVIYGTNGVWLADSMGKSIADFDRGLPDAADHRQVRNVIVARGRLYAATSEAVYRYEDEHVGWKAVNIPIADGERLTDIAAKGDTLVAVGRSHLYVSSSVGEPFTTVELKEPKGYTGEVSLFRTVWLLHSGELFGSVGKLAVDAIAIVLIFLCITGIAYWLLPKYIQRNRRMENIRRNDTPKRLLRLSLLLHDKVGRWTIVLTLIIAISGWCLRPPVMIPLVMNKTKAVPLTVLDDNNAWNDRLRMLRYDDGQGDWLLSTSEGMYSLKDFESVPTKLDHTPPISVMGLNVLEKDGQGRWFCGSFSGMFVWDRRSGKSVDFFTHELAPETSGAPFGKKAISGYSQDFAKSAFAVEYYDGTTAIAQPDELRQLPMSLWNFALEVHSGRIYIGTYATLFFVFFAGLAAAWCLWSGWKIRRRQGNRLRK